MKIQKASSAILPLAGLLLLFGCEHTVFTSDSSGRIDYARQVQPIFTNNCAFANCHLDGSSPSELVLTNFEKISEGAHHGNAVIPFEPALSHLFQHINGDSNLSPQAEPPMPYQRPRLAAADIMTISKWIKQGATDESGAPMYADASEEHFIITNQSDDFLTLISSKTGLISRIVPLFAPTWPFPHTPPRAPHYVTVAPDKRTAYVSLIASGLLLKIDLPSRTIVKELALGGSLAHIEIVATGDKAVVSNFSNQNAIHVIDLASFTEERRINNVFYNPHGMAVLPDGKTLFTAGNVSDLLYRIDISIGASQSYKLSNLTPDVGETSSKLTPYQIRFNPDDDNLYVSCSKTNEVRIWNTQSQTFIDSFQVGRSPLLMDFNSDRTELWVACKGDNSIAIIDVLSRSIKDVIQDLPDQPHGVKFSSDGKTVGLTCEHVSGELDQHHPGTRSGSPGVFVLIDAATRTIIAEREVGGFAAGIDVIP